MTAQLSDKDILSIVGLTHYNDDDGNLKVEAIFSHKPSWHHQGTVTEGRFITKDELLSTIGAEIEIAPVKDAETDRVIDGYVTLRHAGTKQNIHIGSNTVDFYQRDEMIESISSIIDQFENEGGGISSGLTLHNGTVSSVSLSTSDQAVISPNWHEKCNLVFLDSINSRYSFKIVTTRFRPECQNTVHHASLLSGISLRHTANFKERADVLLDSLSAWMKEQQLITSNLQAFLEHKINEQSMVEYLQKVYEIEGEFNSVQDLIEKSKYIGLHNALKCLQTEDIIKTELSGTLGGLYNACTSQANHTVDKGKGGDTLALDIMSKYRQTPLNFLNSTEFKMLPAVEQVALKTKALERERTRFSLNSTGNLLCQRAYKVGCEMLGLSQSVSVSK